jgi:hypothetical protein
MAWSGVTTQTESINSHILVGYIYYSFSQPSQARKQIEKITVQGQAPRGQAPRGQAPRGQAPKGQEMSYRYNVGATRGLGLRICAASGRFRNTFESRNVRSVCCSAPSEQSLMQCIHFRLHVPYVRRLLMCHMCVRRCVYVCVCHFQLHVPYASVCTCVF